jgi:hypothetical protein
MAKHLHRAFCEHWTPLKVRWWLFCAESVVNSTDDNPSGRYGHFDVLCDMLGGRSAEETEQLEHCFQRVYYGGARDPWHGWTCVCLRESTSAGEARGSIGGDGTASILALIVDLERAADALPLPWRATEAVFNALGHPITYRDRMKFLARGVVRDVDRELEPIDPETRRPRSRQLVEAWMAYELGYRDRSATCRWPRKPNLAVVDQITTLPPSNEEAA